MCRIVVGIQDARHSEICNSITNSPWTTLAVTAVRRSEQVRQQQTVLRGTEIKPTTPVNAVHKGRKHRLPADKKQNGPNKAEKCSKCENHLVTTEIVAQLEAICRKYKKQGHFQTVCNQK